MLRLQLVMSSPKLAARTPYRGQQEVLARYPLKRFPVVLGGVLLAILLIPLIWFQFGAWLYHPLGWVLIAVTLLTPPIAASFVPGYSVAGGSAELRLYRDRLELPRPFGREPFRIPIADVRIAVHAYDASGTRVLLPSFIIVTAPGVHRSLRAELFGSATAMQAAVDDILRVQKGLDLEGGVSGPPPRDAYDDKLDEELRELE